MRDRFASTALLNPVRSPADICLVGDYDFFAASPAPHEPVTPATPAMSQWGPPTAPGAPPTTGTTLSPDEQQMLASSTATAWSHLHGSPSSYSPSSRLGFINSVRVGFQLLPTCWSVLSSQPSLLIVPFLVLVAGVLSVLGYADILGGSSHLVGSNKYSTAVRIFPIAAFVTAIGVVGQAVVVAAATNTLQGHRNTLSAAWVTAGTQLPRLVFFGVVYAGERTLTSLLRGRRRWSIGTIAANTIDRAWDFATFLTIPVLLYEDLPVFAAVKRSGSLVGKRWGVQLTARSVFGIAMFVVMLPVLLIGFLLISVSPVLATVVIIVGVLAMVVTSSALTGVLSAALYRFSVTGQVAPGFSEADMWAVFSRR
jgi:Family of unknown function (DUF6159)